MPRAAISHFLFRASIAICCALILSLAAIGQSYSPGEIRVSSHPYFPPQAALRVNTKEVQVEVVVRDSRGKPMGGLSQNQFQLFDKGRLRNLSGFVAQATQSPTPISAYRKPKAAAIHSEAAVEESNANQPTRGRFIAIFFDDIHILPGDFRRTQIAAERFVHEAMAPDDRLGIFTDSSTTVLDFTGDKAKLSETIEGMRARTMITEGSAADCPLISPFQAIEIVDGDLNALDSAYAEAKKCKSDGTDVYTDPQIRGAGSIPLNSPEAMKDQTLQSVLFQARQLSQRVKLTSQMTLSALESTISRLSGLLGDRMLLVASPGFLTEHLDPEVDEIIVRAVHDQIVINALDAKGLYYEGPSRPPDVVAHEGILPAQTFIYENTTFTQKLQAGQSAMENFAMGTGGLLFRNNNDLDYGFYELGVVPAFSYVLSFSADDVKPDGSYHDLKLKVDRPNSNLEYRPGYFAPTVASTAASAVTAPQASKLDQAVASTEGLSEISASFTPKAAKSVGGAQQITVTIHVDLKSLQFERKEDREVQRLDLILALFDAQNNFVTAKRGEFDLALKADSFTRLQASGINGTLSLEAPAGVYRLRAVAQEAVTGKVAAMTLPVDIP